MILGIYAIRDLKSGFMTPTVEQNDAVAIRNFEHAVQQGNSVLFSHASDFQLMHLGEYDTESGRIVPDDLIEIVFDGKDVEL